MTNFNKMNEMRDKILEEINKRNYIIDPERLKKTVNFLTYNKENPTVEEAIKKIYEKRYSFTKFSSYQGCPRQYMHYYKDYIRSKYTSSPLFFGSAFDSAINCLLLQRKKVLTDEEKILVERNPFEVFDEKFEQSQINYQPVENFPISEFAEYSTVDFSADVNEKLKKIVDLPLLKQEDIEVFSEMADELGFSIKTKEEVVEFFSEMRPKKTDEEILVGKERQLYNFLGWILLRRKGHVMLHAYISEIFPQIEEVYEIQKHIDIYEENEEGKRTARILTGEIDAIVRLVGEDHKRILDNKTTSTKYSEESATESEQLAVYSFAENIPDVCYATVEKKMRKKEPLTRTQIVKGKISEEFQEKMLEKYINLMYNIEEGNFPMNEENCFAYGRLCDYKCICKHNTLSSKLFELYPKK